MFDHRNRGSHARPEHARARSTVREIFEHLVARGDEPEEITEFIAGMTDRFALDYAGRL
jgi:dGTP triphosphohydrolase